ncbi:ATP-binding protein [Brumimicrobium mesophilum]|uniref:ATP-binding protein n=1 Tax=Brumimicrobium mesophilum TaxID=392717 RepID=UPI001F2D6AD9|nr:ATP-binding protein [Brumimicrobium mesophilum]
MVNSPYVYALGLAVYCSAWTYYGSVGAAARTGPQFLTIYLGPVLAAPLWIIILTRVVKISKSYNVASIADFISLRYGNNRALGALVTLICAASIIPYISLQLKALSETFQLVTSGSTEISHNNWLEDTSFYIALSLALFVTFFGTLSLDASKNKKGIMFSIAFESILKLLFFLIIGIYVTFYLFNGTGDIYCQAEDIIKVKSLEGLSEITSGINWFFNIALSFLAIFLLPRQFQTSVIEYANKKQISKAMWVFPLYLLLFNIFVIFIAWAGIILLGDNVNYDYLTILIPMSQGNNTLAVMVFLGGLSSVISMVVVSTLALSTMLSNNLIIPYGFLGKFSGEKAPKNEKTIKNIRRIAVFSSIALAYGLYAGIGTDVPLFDIGLISFLIIAQLAPSFFFGLFWNRGSSKGAIIGIIIGFAVIMYTYLWPFIAIEILENPILLTPSLFGVEFLHPHYIMGIDYLTPMTHALYLSLLMNCCVYLYFSLFFKGNYRERNYGEVFVNADDLDENSDTSLVWDGKAYMEDIQSILVRFLGEKRTKRAVTIFRKRYKISEDEILADARFINFSEKLLTGAVGSASAKILIAKVANEKPVSLPNVLKILQESKEAFSSSKLFESQSIELRKLTEELRKANEALIFQDKQKDNFLDTVAHELKTPITSIYASAEILQEDTEVPQEIRQQFLNNILADAKRLTRLINDILDLEKLASGREKLDIQKMDISKTIESAIPSFDAIKLRRNLKINRLTIDSYEIEHDREKITQVLTNIISNALKFIQNKVGEISISGKIDKSTASYRIEIADNGPGIPQQDVPFVFDKFYQSQDQTLKKPKGSGFGLAISKQIIEIHNGKINVDKLYSAGTKIVIEIPLKKDKYE